MVTPETLFGRKVKKYIRDNGGYVVKYHGNAMSTNGTPDLLACINGHFVGIELKATRGKFDLQGIQAHRIKEIRDAGGYAMCLYPSAFDKFTKFVNELKSGKDPSTKLIVWK